MMSKLCQVFLLLLATGLSGVAVNAAVYHVATTGSDTTGDGSQSKPWRTISKAADAVRPGDTVNVRAGVYNERVALRANGTAANRIIFQGERGPNGEWLTIIDPSVDASSGWVSAPEIGAGVFKHTNLPFEPGAVIVDGKNLEGVWKAYLPDRFSLFNQSAESQTSSSLFPAGGEFWDGVEGMWGWHNNTCYLRFRNGDNPNLKNIRVSDMRNATNKNSPVPAALRFMPAQFNTVRNFHVRGARVGIAAQSISGVGTSHSVIESNYVEHGYLQILFIPQAQGSCNDNIIRNNVLRVNRYGFDDLGPWGSRHPETWPRFNAYTFNKHQYGQTDNSSMIALFSAGSRNQIVGNSLSGGLDAIRLAGNSLRWSAPASGTVIAENIISNFAMSGLMIEAGHDETHYSSNVVQNVHYQARWQSLNREHAYPWTLYVYRNKGCNPEGLGGWVYLHAWPNDERFSPTIWAYHNTYSGGAIALNVSGGGDGVSSRGGLPNVRFVNNLFCSFAPFLNNPAFGSDPNMMGAFDYNYVRGSSSDVSVAWYGPNNVRRTSPAWDPATQILSPGASLPSAAVDAGLDLSKTFVLRGVSYPALPGAKSASISGSAPDMGAVEAGQPVVQEAPRTPAGFEGGLRL